MGFAGALARTSARVIGRRLRGKRRHPAWTLPYEIGVEISGMAVDPNVRPESLPGGQRRADLVAPTPPGLWGALRFERTTLAGLPTEVQTSKQHVEGGPTLLYIHGGGYSRCAPATHRSLIARLAHAAKLRAVAIDYRKAPEHPFPAAIEDCLAAYGALLQEGVDSHRLAVAGDSAGAGLVMALAQRIRQEGLRQPAALVLLSPWADLTQLTGGSLVDNNPYDYLPGESLPQFVAEYLAGADPKSPLASPVFADFSGLPPMLVLTGSLEIFYDQNLDFVQRARAQGADVTHEIGTEQVHVYPLLADVSKPARRAIRSIGAFIQSHTTGD